MTIVVPFHQDERLPAGSLPVPGDRVVTPPLPDGDIWTRLTALHDAVADAVADALAGTVAGADAVVGAVVGAVAGADAVVGADADEVADAGAGAVMAGAGVDEVVAAETPPVVVSGDCLVALGVLAGAQRAGADPSLIWFDAHGDVHTLETSTSGYLGGLSLRLALGAHADRVAGPLGLRPLPEDRVTLVDARDLDPAEADYLSTAAIHRRPVTDVEVPDGPVVLHIDLDVIDAAELPGLLFPVPDGPSTDAVVEAVRRILDSGRVVALSIACPWHPADDPRRAELLTALTT